MGVCWAKGKRKKILRAMHLSNSSERSFATNFHWTSSLNFQANGNKTRAATAFHLQSVSSESSGVKNSFRNCSGSRDIDQRSCASEARSAPTDVGYVFSVGRASLPAGSGGILPPVEHSGHGCPENRQSGMPALQVCGKRYTNTTSVATPSRVSPGGYLNGYLLSKSMNPFATSTEAKRTCTLSPTSTP